MQIVEVVLRECKKENTKYRMKALQCAGRILELYEIDRFETLWVLLQPTLNKVWNKCFFFPPTIYWLFRWTLNFTWLRFFLFINNHYECLKIRFGTATLESMFQKIIFYVSFDNNLSVKKKKIFLCQSVN